MPKTRLKEVMVLWLLIAFLTNALEGGKRENQSKVPSIL